MANNQLFQRELVKPANAVNEAGGKAYDLGSKGALAQYATTGCFNDTFYTRAENQLDKVLKLCQNVPDEFVAKLAVYTNETSFMKDSVSFLVAYLMTRELDLFERAFNKVMKRGDQVRTFVQIIRSGVLGRRSFGTRPKRVVKNWINNRRLDYLFQDSVGNEPSLADIIRMVRPNPGDDKARNALYGYLTGNKYDAKELPDIVADYEAFKKVKAGTIPNVRFEQLAGLDLTNDQWKELAALSSWTTVRMNLNTFLRHGVLSDKEMVTRLANKLRMVPTHIFPYQILTAFQNVESGVPQELTLALQDAMEEATKNVPFIEGEVVVGTDVSNSMKHPVTGHRDGSTTKTRCIDVAALMAASILRTNNNARIMPFNGEVVDLKLNPRDSVMTNAQKLAAIGGGSTYCASVIKKLNQEDAKVDYVIFTSDNESWVNGTGGYGCRGKSRLQTGTDLMLAWRELRKRNPNAKMVCIDIQPGATTQALDDPSILNIGGFSDNVFKVVSKFFDGNKNDWIEEIERTEV